MKHGGKRKNAGRKEKYGEETVVIGFRCPKSKTKTLRILINKKLKTYENNQN